MAATLGDYVLDNGLNALQMATHIHVTNAELTTYAAVTNVPVDLAYNLSPREFAEAPVVRSPNGSKVHTLSTTLGGHIVNGEAHYWYFIDEVNDRLLARGAITGSVLYIYFSLPDLVTPYYFPAYIPPGDNVQIPSVASNGIVDPWVLNNGLEGLKAQANKVYICNALPTTWTEATSTFALGNKDYGTGGVYTGQSVAAGSSPTGRQLLANSSTGGNVTASGTASHIGVVDSANSRFLVGMSLGTGGPASVTSGQHFALGGFTVKLVSN